jgi:hypothetical protein
MLSGDTNLKPVEPGKAWDVFAAIDGILVVVNCAQYLVFGMYLPG